MRMGVPYDSRKVMVVAFLLLLSGLSACQRHDVKLQAEAISDRSSMPVLEAIEVTTLISDSGVTRYRIQAPKWLMFDKATPSYWEFPDGILLEKFNEQLETDAMIRADYAYYDEPAQRWRLQGHVHAMNQQGEQFDTPLLYWDQKEESIYSDSSIVITKANSVIQGIGFRSNQDMTLYTIQRPTGSFPIEE